MLFNVLYKVVLSCQSVDEILNSLAFNSNQLVAEQYFPVILFIMLHKVALTFESVDEFLSKV